MTTLFFGFYSLALTLAVAILWIKSSRPAKEDPRLSRGLQLLQSKISVLEDLSDRTEKQVQQLMALLEERARILQGKILQAHETMAKIDQSMSKSLNVAKIFQDKIPHEEIIERQNSAKFVLAAKMAHQGKSVEEIMQEVDLPLAEVEFIAKVNRDELSFSEEHLPEWAKTEARITEAFSQPKYDLSGLTQVQNNFKTAVKAAEDQARAVEERRRNQEIQQQQLIDGAKKAAQTFVTNASQVFHDVGQKASQVATQAAHVASTAATHAAHAATSAAQAATSAATRPSSSQQASGPVIRKVQFPRIDDMDR
ncbi:MAG: DUF2802 domain-containing protein [Bdellovibrionota bacterium]